MATYTTARTATGVPARQIHPGLTGESFFYSCSTSNSAGDVVQLFRVGPGARLLELQVGATSAVNSYSLGDGDNSSRYLATATVATTVVSRITISNALGYSYSVADTVDLRWDVSGALAGTTIRGTAIIAYDQQEIV